MSTYTSKYANGAAVDAALDKAESALQPADLAPVATSGSYADLADTPTLGSAAAQDVTAFDPAGAASDAVSSHESAYTHSLIATALQPGDIDDESTATDKLWSAAKISSELGDIASALDALNGESV